MRILLAVAALGLLAYLGFAAFPEIAVTSAPDTPDAIIFLDPAQPDGFQAEQFFRSRGMNVLVRDVSTDATARAEYVRRGARGLPMIIIRGDQLDGFRQWEAERLLDSHARRAN
jgi:hypothetical protein